MNSLPAQSQLQNAKTQQQGIDHLFEAADLRGYFQSRPSFSDEMSWRTSKHFTDKVVKGLDVLLTMGALAVSRQRQKVSDLMDHSQIREQQLRAMELKTKKQYIQQQLQYLHKQTTISNLKQPLENVKDSRIVLTKEEHAQLVVRLKKERAERDKKHREMVQKLEKSRIQAEEMEKKAIEEGKKQQLKRRREMIEASLEKHKQRHEEFLKIEQQSKQKLQNIKTKKFTYQQIQQNYQKSVLLPNLQQKKRKLKQLREYKSFNVEQLKEHERTYLQHHKLQQSRRSQTKQQWHYVPPPKSQRLEVILEEERLQRIKALEEKKKQLEDRIEKQDNYVSYLRQHFAPRVDPAKEQEIKIRIQKSRLVKPEPNSLKQINEIGMSYLEHAKKHRKIMKTIDERPETVRKTTNISLRTEKQTQVETKPRSVTNYLTLDKDRDEHFYQQVRRRRLQRLKKQQGISQADRIKQLKIEADKINQKMIQKQKEAKYKKDQKLKENSLDLLLSSIQAKIGIIQMYQ